MHFEKKVRRFKRDKNSKKPIVETKPRNLFYASHKDAYIYSYYNLQLKQKYEDFLAKHDLGSCVIGYRSGLGSNITFAKEVFSIIQERRQCAVLGFDISGFFDNMEHSILEKQWCALLGLEKLPKDHLKIFRALTRYSWVNKSDCYERLGIGKKATNVPNPLCSPREFREIIVGNNSLYPSLIQTNAQQSYGIPQGTPISATLSNIYMMDFDLKMHKLASELQGVYRRYSDDILWVCKIEEIELIENTVNDAIRATGSHLFLNERKTIRSRFEQNSAGELHADVPFQYLGFTFDGQKALIRPHTLSKYYRKLIYKVRAAKNAAWRAYMQGKQVDCKVYKRGLYRSVTSLGKSNFHTYVSVATRIMNEPKIKGQVRKHWVRVQQELSPPSES